MDIVEIRTKDGKTIYLRDKQWKHIKQRHPEIANRLNEIEEAVRSPTAVIRYSDTTTKFYKFIKKEKKYMMVAVRLLNDKGYIVTAYPTKKIQRDKLWG